MAEDGLPGVTIMAAVGAHVPCAVREAGCEAHLLKALDLEKRQRMLEECVAHGAARRARSGQRGHGRGYKNMMVDGFRYTDGEHVF